MKMTELLNAVDTLSDAELKDLIEYACLELELRRIENKVTD